jgi:transposase-like protein
MSNDKMSKLKGKRGRGTEKKELVIVAVSVWKDKGGEEQAVFASPHRGVSRKHLQSYLSEVCYRFNRRFWGRGVFHRLLFACASTSTITRDGLMSKHSGQLSQ